MVERGKHQLIIAGQGGCRLRGQRMPGVSPIRNTKLLKEGVSGPPWLRSSRLRRCAWDCGLMARME